MTRPRTVASAHNEWLALVDAVGAFLTIPILKRAFPNGIPPVDPDMRAEVRQRLETLSRDDAARSTWLQFVLRDLLGLNPRLRESAGVPTGLTCSVPQHSATLRPDFAVMEPQADGPGLPRMIIFRWPLGTALDRRPSHDQEGRATRWPASPIERAAIACRTTKVPLAMVTDTDRFALVWAPQNAPGGHATWASSLFGEERTLLDSFVAVLGVQRFFGVAADETLEALLTESGAAQHEITDKLGSQVREAVELLVGAFSRAHRASGSKLLARVPPSEVYNAAVTVMMRLVVLLAAEERRLLPADDELYTASYSVTALRDRLDAEAMRDTLEALETRQSAWDRLLATFRMVYGGVQHDRLQLPAYGGSLFDPDRYSFLEGRTQSEPWRLSPAVPLPVDDRSTLAILDALQILTFRVGGVTEARRLSYLNLDVEQIGHVYEGLLDHGCERTSEVALGLIGRKGDEPEVRLAEIEAQLEKGEDAFCSWIEDRGGPPGARVRKLLYEEPDPDHAARLLAACDHDEEVVARVRPFLGLVRTDLRDLPAVFMPGSLYVTQVSLRRDSGTAYTTKELADEVARYALEPLVYSPGPADGIDPSTWKRKSSAQLLRLKVCDPAVGSGAILVAACRYLAGQLVEAWASEGEPQTDDDVIRARRAVTDHCLYGVDRNPMAVEMAKLSLWLTTMAKERPFTFLDHQIRCGDSLLGITSLDQVRWFHIDPAEGRELHAKLPLFDPTKAIDPRVSAALATARKLATVDVVTLRDVEDKARLHAAMVAALQPLAIIANAVVGAALATATKAYRPPWLADEEEPPDVSDLLESLEPSLQAAFDESEDDERHLLALREMADTAAQWLDTDRVGSGGLNRSCLHWPLVFPEVFLAEGRSGFDGIVGNPPFLGGQRITGAMGTAYRNFLVERIASGKRGSADLVAYFYLRAFDLLSTPGSLGLLATNTIAQGDTREVGLDQLFAGGAAITRAIPSEPWPGTTSLEIAKVWLYKGPWHGAHMLSGEPVKSISPSLSIPSRVTGKPFRLKANEGKSFQGSIVLGMGFVMTPEDAEALIAKSSLNREALSPYLNGEDLNSRPDQSPSRWVINFRGWPLDRDAVGSWSSASNDARHAWVRSGHVPKDYVGPVAADYPDCLAIVRRKVKPERDRNKRKVRRDRWWQFAERAPDLYTTIAGLDRVLVVAATSRTLAFAFCDPGITFSHATYVFALESTAAFGVLQSAIHEAWARKQASSMKQDLRYTPSDCFDTFAFPTAIDTLDEVGRNYYDHRQAVMRARHEGLTKTYNRFHDQSDRTIDSKRLRDLHVELDRAVVKAYGWSDLTLNHDFQETISGCRFSVGPVAHQEIVDRLLELNHERYADEVVRGLHEKKDRAGDSKRRARAVATDKPALF